MAPDPVVAEFVEDLALLARRHAGRPHEELEALWRIGLERESIVSVAYRHDAIGQRLRRMPIDDETRAVIARAVRWAWRDEEAHALWVRGAHMRWQEMAGSVVVETRGRIGGWMSSRQQNLKISEAPVVRAVAETLELVGVATGRIPRAVRPSLRWGTFVETCSFNRSAEVTAAMAWRRMAELAAGHPDARGFARMAADEDRHARVFAVLRDAFDRDDRLVIATSDLRARLREVGERFIALPDRDQPAWRNPLGKGGSVIVRDGDEPVTVVDAVMDASGLAAKLQPGAVVAIKTTFMLVTRRDDLSPGVTPAVLAAVIAWLERRGANVRVIDARNIYDAFHGHRGVREVAAYLGIAGDIVDAQDEQVPHVYARGLGVETIAKTWRDADFRIALGKLRSHPTSTALLSLEAAEGLGARHDDLLFLERRAERETAILMALDTAPPDLALLDAWSDVPDGLMGVLGTDRPLSPHRLYASTDAVALDAVACRHIGAAPDFRDGMLVDIAFDWFGDPRATTTVDGPDSPIAGFRLPDHSLRTSLLAQLAMPVFTLASGRGALFVPPVDETAFPPTATTSPVTRLARTIVRRVVADPPTERRASGALLPTRQLATAAGTIRIARVGHGAPVVFLHGYPDTLQLWFAIAPRVGGDGREAVAFDWPGLGGSEPCNAPADPSTLADQLRAVLDATQLDRVDLVATDMGGPPALVAAARFPDRVRSVVVMNSMLFGDAPTSLEIAIMRRANLAAAAFRIASRLVYARCKHSFLEHETDLPAAVDDDFRGAFEHARVRKRIAQMCEAYERSFSSLPAHYWKIRCPVYVLWAEHDHHFSPEHGRRLCKLVPGARMEVIPGARHWMMVSRAHSLAARLATQLAS